MFLDSTFFVNRESCAEQQRQKREGLVVYSVEYCIRSWTEVTPVLWDRKINAMVKVKSAPIIIGQARRLIHCWGLSPVSVV